MARSFVHLPPNGSPAIFWRSSAVERYAGEQFQVNLNLLAHTVGDDPRNVLRSLR